MAKVAKILLFILGQSIKDLPFPENLKKENIYAL
jgi:hypothetical protein